jgi:hypothetical protein
MLDVIRYVALLYVIAICAFMVLAFARLGPQR